MNLKDQIGVFKVIDSFIIRRKKEFYLIGQLSKGELKEGFYINITLNSSLVLSAKIFSVEDVEISNDNKIYQLILVKEPFDNELDDFLFCQNVENEDIYITLTGEDY